MIEELRKLKHQILSLFARGTASLVDDSQGIQELQIELMKDETFDKVERFQNYGFTSVPKPGAEIASLFFGGRRDHGIVICVDDRRYRLKGLKEGEVAIYTDEGDSIILKRGNKIEVTTKEYIVNAQTKITLKAPLVTIDALQTNATGKVNAADDITSDKKLVSLVGVFAPGYNGPTAGAAVVANGNLEASGNVKDSAGTMAQMRSTYNSHTHKENNTASGQTDAPTQGM